MKQTPLTIAPKSGSNTFFNFPLACDFENFNADLAILGLPHGMPYTKNEAFNDQTNAPAAIRKASEWACRALHRYDFDLGGTLFDGRTINAVDCGDVDFDSDDVTGHYRRAELAVRKILDAGALPICLGGDHGVPIPVFRAFENRGPIHLIQLDAHIDWRDQRNGVREGYSSTIRRASEMPHIDQIFQIGLRSQGSARMQEYEAARDYGATLITACQLHDEGAKSILDVIPDGAQYYITVDADGFDPAVMPAVAGPAPGGITYYQACKLIAGLVCKGRVVGMDIVEITPSRDLNDITSITASRLIAYLMGSAVRAGYFK